MAFIQFIKQCGMLFVYVFSLAMPLTTFEWTRVQLLGFVIVVTVVTIMGEVDFALEPFLIQGTAVVLDAGLVTQQDVALTDSKARWTP